MKGESRGLHAVSIFFPKEFLGNVTPPLPLEVTILLVENTKLHVFQKTRLSYFSTSAYVNSFSPKTSFLPTKILCSTNPKSFEEMGKIWMQLYLTEILNNVVFIKREVV